MLDIQSLPSLERFDSAFLDSMLKGSDSFPTLHTIDESADQRGLQFERATSGLAQFLLARADSQPTTQPTAGDHAEAHNTQHNGRPQPLDLQQGFPGFCTLGQTSGASGERMPDLYQPTLSAGPCAPISPRGRSCKRKNRGARLDEFIKAEESSDNDSANDSRHSTQSPGKRHRGGGNMAESDQGVRSGSFNIDMDDDEDCDKNKMRREKNRVAARKCRAKKTQFMVEMQKTLRDLMRKNEEYKLQVITWHKMFSREVRLREAMKRIITAAWASGSAPAAALGITAIDVIIGLEAGTLDVNALVRAMASCSGQGIPLMPTLSNPDCSMPLDGSGQGAMDSNPCMMPNIPGQPMHSMGLEGLPPQGNMALDHVTQGMIPPGSMGVEAAQNMLLPNALDGMAQNLMGHGSGGFDPQGGMPQQGLMGSGSMGLQGVAQRLMASGGSMALEMASQGLMPPGSLSLDGGAKGLMLSPGMPIGATAQASLAALHGKGPLRA